MLRHARRLISACRIGRTTKDPFATLEARQIGEHVTKRGGAVITIASNAPIELDLETSALSYFAAPRVNVPDVEGQWHEINHLERLREAERRIDAAIRRARSGAL